MKALEFIYQETEIHFLVNGDDRNLMINATEMAKAFGKRIDHFLRSDHAKAFIESLKKQLEFPPYGGNSDSKTGPNGPSLGGEFTPYGVNLDTERPPNGGRSDDEIMNLIIKTKGQSGTYFHKALALKFAAWLDSDFEVWVYTKIEEVVFGNYKKHYDAHLAQERAKLQMERLKKQMVKNPTTEMVVEYFEAESDLKNAQKAKMKALRSQYNLFWNNNQNEQ